MSLSSQFKMDAQSVSMLSRIGLTEKECVEMNGKFNTILESFKVVAGVDVGHADQALESQSAMDLRADVSKPAFGQKIALENAPHQALGHFRVPAVL
jgi:aspartyl/glutamyl-tRNA(Asn/Gln) amidotransferase C subunit